MVDTTLHIRTGPITPDVRHYGPFSVVSFGAGIHVHFSGEGHVAEAEAFTDRLTHPTTSEDRWLDAIDVRFDSARPTTR